MRNDRASGGNVSPVVTTALVAVSALLFAAALACLYVSTRPLSFFQAAVVRLGLGQFAPYLTSALYAGLVRRCRIGALALAVASIAILLLRNWTGRTARRVLAMLVEAGLEMRQDTGRALRREPRPALVALAVITAIGAWARARWLFQPMREDEAYTFLFFASKPLFFGLSVYHNNNNHLFHTLLTHLAYLGLGGEPWAIRLPAYVAGLLMVPAAYLVARLLDGSTVALMTAGLVAASSFLIEFSTNARGYTWLCLCFLIGLSAAVYASRRNNIAGWILFAGATAIGFFTMPLMLYPFGTTMVWLMWYRPEAWRSYVGATAAAAVAALVLYGPVLAVSGPAAILANPYVVAHPIGEFLRDTGSLLPGMWADWNRDWPAAVVWILAAGFAAGQVWLLVRRRAVLQLPPATVAFSFAALLIQRIVLGDRLWIFALPIYLMAAAAGLAAVVRAAWRRLPLPAWCGPVVAVVLCFWLAAGVVRSPSIGRSLETGVLPDADAIASTLQDQFTGRDVVYSSGISKIVLQYYFLRRHLPEATLYPEGAPPDRAFLVLNEAYDETARSVLKEFGVDLDETTTRVRMVRQFPSAGLYEIENGAQFQRGLR